MGREIDIFLSVILAMLMGGVVGVERESANKPAGLRTNMLVAGAAAFIVHLADLLVQRSMASGAADPLRVIEAVVTGVSFIGAGTIIRRSEDLEVEGLTTAATLLFTSALGMAVALGEPWLAAALTVLVIATLRVLVFLEKRMPKQPKKSERI
jgi:putative Mg2+ transporter-C (MgtC) family protein